MNLDKRNLGTLNKDLEDAWVRLNNEFPFKGYINHARKSGYFNMVRKVAKWTGTDVSVLDFGAGPCDKTALFSLVGMQVTAFDDLQDSWHKIDGNRDTILKFAESVGITYALPDKKKGFNIPIRSYQGKANICEW